jgi:glutamyl-tRNA reductase
MSARWTFFALGLSFRTAPVSLREQLAFRAVELPGAVEQLREQCGFREAVILSTCNRVEIFVIAPAHDGQLSEKTRSFLASYRGISRETFEGALYEFQGEAAARHLFEVTASLDSQVLGETEILSQTREAFRVASEAGAVGRCLQTLFERAFNLAKELRSAGGVGHGRASISSAAVNLVERIFDDLKEHPALVLGTGEMATGIVKSLKAAGVTDFLVAARTSERSEAFARETGSRCGPLEKLAEHLLAADIVLVSTAAPHYILTVDHLSKALDGRHGRPLFVIDISVPRNVDPAAQDLPGVFLYDIDDLDSVAREGRERREEAAERWRPRLAEEAGRMLNELQDEAPDQAAKRLLQQVSALRQAELDELRRSGKLDAPAIEQLGQSLARFQAKLLHGPLSALKEASREGDGGVAAEWVERLFRLPQSGEEDGERGTGNGE